MTTTVHESIVSIETIADFLYLQLLGCLLLGIQHAQWDYIIVFFIDLILFKTFQDFHPVNCIMILYIKKISLACIVLTSSRTYNRLAILKIEKKNF